MKDAFKETFGLLLRLGVGAIVGRLAGGWGLSFRK